MKVKSPILPPPDTERSGPPHVDSYVETDEETRQPHQWRETAGYLAEAVQTLENLKTQSARNQRPLLRLFAYSAVLAAFAFVVLFWLLYV